ncbi:NADH-quinone oxidoreductase subunit J [Halorhodospira abdelmalekii]|uniref:NAD(P)H-dependent oxidoreductase subunit E n=1 Tax=Halorhodospira abdelmalekii TaxID=421629 RepID=UPI0019059577|nr:NAD(P)H-dependent oxidoreductase subunit E [Halorhodospira abdelmalekii]MBK1735429.1 NADH-quinone oxidoreductase subunit J [Halorhodospira abdelmalekii]
MLVTEQERLREFVEAVVAHHGASRDQLIPILLAVQDEYGWISDFASQHIADQLAIHASEVYGVATFYHFINTRPKGRFVIRLSADMPSLMNGAEVIARQLERDLGIAFGETTADGLFTLEWTSCIGMNDQAPAMLINQAVFSALTPERVRQILDTCRQQLRAHRPICSETKETYVDGLSYAAYQAESALSKALQRTPQEVAAELEASGLRGLGGAGFPTGAKWRLVAEAEGETKYVVCNADEGEPGTFKDRVTLERYAALMCEGMTLAAYVTGAREGIIYLRWEYGYLRPQLEALLTARREAGLLGCGIMGKAGFDFDIRIQMGAGAYVCGEETALLESLEGFRGEPRNRIPYPVDFGLHGQPTVVNNVETFATTCLIVDRGAEWFTAMGTERSKGFKLLSVSGDCAKPGVYEVPWGTTVAGLLERVGGGGAKAVQVGGYAGHLVPAALFERKIAYEEFGTSGSIIVYGPQRDLLVVAENYLKFFVAESCGQCTPCRDGNAILLEGMQRLRQGRCTTDQLEQLIELGKSMQVASLCGLGQSSPKILLDIAAHFKDEVMARPIAA